MQQDQAQVYYQQLINQEEQIGLRYQAVFQLKNIGTENSIHKLIQAYPHLSSSVLLSHEALYALGQLEQKNLPLFKEFLISVVQNQKENSLSRHEAAQALANYFLPELESLYSKHLNSECKELRWTCEIAIEKVRRPDQKSLYGKLYFGTKEPAAPFSKEQFQEFLQLSQLTEVYQQKGYLGVLLKENLSLWSKYRIMYFMRNENTVEARRTLCQLLSRQFFKTQTSLLKHEICFILGQIGCQNYQHLIRECIENQEEEPIVRHEALAAVASQSKDVNYLEKFIKCPNGLIRESAQVAQFSIKYWND